MAEESRELDDRDLLYEAAGSLHDLIYELDGWKGQNPKAWERAGIGEWISKLQDLEALIEDQRYPGYRESVLAEKGPGPDPITVDVNPGFYVHKNKFLPHYLVAVDLKHKAWCVPAVNNGWSIRYPLTEKDAVLERIDTSLWNRFVNPVGYPVELLDATGVIEYDPQKKWSCK